MHRAVNYRIAALVAGALVIASVAHAYFATINKTDHKEMHLVPTPGPVLVDGDLNDWDMSGAILMFLDEGSKKVYSVRAAMMYDADALYVGAHVKDPSPMVNHYGFGGEVNMSWNADAIQLRFVSDPAIQSDASLQTGGRMSAEQQKHVCHFTLWYSTLDKKPGFFICYTLGFRDGQLNPKGVAAAYKKDADGKGYKFEYRVPWSVLHAPRALKGGDKVQLQWQLHWGQKSGRGLKHGMTDVRNPASGDLGYMGPACWGTGIVEATGNIKLAEEGAAGRAEGHIPVTFKLDEARSVSLAVYDAKGALVRTCLGAEPYEAGEHTYMWDGLSDRDVPAPAGRYTFKLLTHKGVEQKLVCDVGVSGTPPYQTEDGTGGWAGDYGFPTYVATDGDLVVLGTGSAEAAPASVCADLEGRKLYGTTAGGLAVTLHRGSGYVVGRGSGKLTKFDVKRGYLSPFAGGNPDVPLITKKPGEDRKEWGARSWGLRAIAVVRKFILVTSYAENRVIILDLASGQQKGEILLAAPAGIAADVKGNLWAVSGKTVGRLDLGSGRFKPVVKDLDNPRHLACDDVGNVYVSLGGKTQQVWKLSSGGKLLQKYGKAGGRPRLGKFNPNGMLNPYGIAVDRNERLWVAESDGQPKRYSVWNPDGTLYKDFFGSMDYATSAFTDLARPEHVYAQGVRYLVDYDKGEWRVDATVLRPRTVQLGPDAEGTLEFSPPAGHPGGDIVNYKGRKFLWTRNTGAGTLYEIVGEQFIPRMTAGGRGRPWWVDASNDGQVQTDELITDPGKAFMLLYWGNPIDPRLNLYSYQGDTWHAQGNPPSDKPFDVVRWDFLGFNDKGGLRYADPKKPTVVAHDSVGGRVAAVTVDGDLNTYAIVSGGSLERGRRAQGSGHRVVMYGPDGKIRWEYHNVHCAFAWTSDSYTPGYVVGAVGFSRGWAQDLIAVTGYYGQYFLLDTKDGLFVDALGEDQRSAYDLGAHMVLTENFNGTLYRNTKNGKSYFIGGDADLRLWELGNLDTARRDAGKLTVTPAMFAQSVENQRLAAEAQASQLGRKNVRVVRLRGAAADGKYDEWTKAKPLPILMEDERAALAQLGYDEKNLYVRFQVTDDSPLLNTPTDFRRLFKSGDAVDVQIGTNLERRRKRGQAEFPVRGDTRLLVTRGHEGKMVATLYRFVTPGKEKPGRFVFESPTGKQVCDDVAAWDDLPMHCAVEEGGYVVELAVPWARLGIAPKSGLVLTGDVGVIFGNKGGTRNAIRYMWSDKSPEVSINNDLPSEVRVHPNHWGRLILE